MLFFGHLIGAHQKNVQAKKEASFEKAKCDAAAIKRVV